MPIVSRTLLAGQSETWFFTGSGFSIVSASGLLSRIEFLRQQKTVEDLVGSFGEGFYFQTPPGSIFDGVRITAQTTGTYSVFIGHGVAGIIETDNAKPVTVTNSEIAVDVQNAILNTEIQNSSLDVDIITQSVMLETNAGSSAGVIANDLSEVDIYTSTPTLSTGSYTFAAGNVAKISANFNLYASSPGDLTLCTYATIKRDGSVIIAEKYFNGVSKDEYSADTFNLSASDSPSAGSHYYTLTLSNAYGNCSNSGSAASHQKSKRRSISALI